MYNLVFLLKVGSLIRFSPLVQNKKIKSMKECKAEALEVRNSGQAVIEDHGQEMNSHNVGGKIP